MAANYNSLNTGGNPSPYGSGDPYYSASTGYITPTPPVKKGVSPWLKFGVPVAILVIVGAVVGGVVGSRNSSSSSSSSSHSGGSGGGDDEAAASSVASVKDEIGRYATATDSEFMMPIYPSTTNAAAFTTPTFINSNNAAVSWPEDPYQAPSPDSLEVRPDRPRIIAPSYKWDALPQLIQSDPYLRGWNDTIFGNATDYLGRPPVAYFLDDSSGILDNAREIKMRIKALAYVWRITKDPKWVQRAWDEIQNAASFGPANDRWNTGHFLDTAELSAAVGIAYDWMNDGWTDDQKAQIRSILIENGLQFGLAAYTDPSVTYAWWRNNITGNWNCVCNGGLTIGALAILGDDDTGVASQLLQLTIPNAKENCALATVSDGTWAETANYWYFGTTGHAEMASALLTATGSHHGLLDVNPNFALAGTYHMYVAGTTSLFNYGDHGPNKFSTTANSMLLYGSQYDMPQYTLFQREQYDAAEPWSMFWYDPSVAGAFWNGAALDRFFDDASDQWASMRSSWTDSNALYLAIKAGKNLGHQTHNDLDVGTFVLDAVGTRWFGELGSADYNAPGYFNSEAQDSARWKYYRKMTEGQNTLLVNRQNQDVNANPTIRHDTSGTAQDSSTVFEVPSDSTAFWVTDMTSAYTGATSMKRGVRLLNGRRQVLLQDEIDVTETVQWRAHTNATVETSGTSATLTLDGQTMTVSILNAPNGAQFSTSAAARFPEDPAPDIPDQENPGVTVLIIELPAGQYNLQVLFNPQWPGMSSSDFVSPPAVALDDWALDSHN